MQDGPSLSEQALLLNKQQEASLIYSIDDIIAKNEQLPSWSVSYEKNYLVIFKALCICISPLAYIFKALFIRLTKRQPPVPRSQYANDLSVLRESWAMRLSQLL